MAAMMRAGTWERGRTAKALGRAWGLSQSRAEELAAEAWRRVCAEADDADQARPTIAGHLSTALAEAHEARRLGEVAKLAHAEPVRLRDHRAPPLGQAAARALGMSGDPVRGSPLPDANVAETAACLGLCAREIELSGLWWQYDHGVMIAYELGTGQPVLVCSHRGRTPMACAEPGERGHLKPLTAERAATLETRAVALHPTLPQKPLRFSDVLKSGIRLYPFDVCAYVLLGILVALLGYAVPTASGLMVDRVIPHRSLNLLAAVLTVVIGTNLSMLFLRRTLEIIAQRIEGGIGTHLQAGMLDRLFRQPLRFFSTYTQAELMRRFNALEGARRSTMRMMASAILDLSALLVGLILLTLYFPKGALVVVGMTSLALLVAIVVAVRSYRAFFEGEVMSTNVMTVVYELVANMWPIRMFGVQRQAFARWRDNFLEMRRRVVRSAGGHTTIVRRTYHPCTPARRATPPFPRRGARSRASAGRSRRT